MDQWVIRQACHASQTDRDLSFSGGIPRLPLNVQIPRCTLCNAIQSFFFQLAFPAGHAWDGATLAVFQCTNCMDEDIIIPPPLEGSPRGAVLSRARLKQAQGHYRLLVFRTQQTQPVVGYSERVAYRGWQLHRCNNPDASELLVGGQPRWLMEDESPSRFDDGELAVFLVQLPLDYRFWLAVGAPPQLEIDWFSKEGGLKPAHPEYYELFGGAAVYLYGPTNPDESVYCVVQTD